MNEELMKSKDGNCLQKCQVVLFPMNCHDAFFPRCILKEEHEGTHYFAFDETESQQQNFPNGVTNE